MSPPIENFRVEFPVIEHGLFLDHARVAPLPRRVREAVENFVKDACDHGTANYLSWMKTTDRVREQFARLINADSDEVAFVKNTSEGLSIVAEGLDWQEGDNVVVPDIEFPSNVYPWMNLKRRGVDVRFVKAVRGRIPFEQIETQVNSRTRLITISSVEFHSGFRNDLKRIGAFCKERGILFNVDAIQSLGVLPMDVKECNIDFLSADGHKWLLSVEGLGGLFVAKHALDKLTPVLTGWDSVAGGKDFLNYDFTLAPGAQRFEEGSFNTMSIHAFGAALSLFEEAGMDAVSERVLHLGDCILEHLWKRNLKVISSTEPQERSGIVSFTVKTDLDQLAQFLSHHSVTVTIRGGLVRLSPHFYNNTEDIDRFFSLLDDFLEKN